MLNVFGLFSGIGGFELGFQRAGCRIVGMCEIDPYCRAVLRKHWPDVLCLDDVRGVTGELLDFLGIRVDVLTGGFPCQDISLAGKGAGLTGERSGLWFEYRRIIEEVRPAWVVIENVSALRSRGLDVVLGSLAALGYDVEWHCIPAAAVGAPHRRDRVWLVAYPARLQPGRTKQRAERERAGAGGQSQFSGAPDDRSGARCELPAPRRDKGRVLGATAAPGEDRLDVANPIGAGLEGRPRLAGHLARQLAAVERGGAVSPVPDANGAGCAQPLGPSEAIPGAGAGESTGSHGGGGHQWLAEPDVGRVAHGVPSRMDRLRALGNAVVPQIPEMIARAILAAELHA